MEDHAKTRLLFLCHPSVAQRHAELIGCGAIGDPLNEICAGESPLSAHPCGRNFTFAGEIVDKWLQVLPIVLTDCKV